MKRLLCLLFIGLTIAFFQPNTASAHGEGPPYVKVNGKYADTNPVTTYNAYPEILKSGLDAAPEEKYLVNTQITFTIDENNFNYPLTYITETEEEVPIVFTWEFPDKTTAEGKEVSYRFTKPGTQIVKLATSYPPAQVEKLEVDTIQMNIVPTRDYQIPKAKMSVNGTNINDPDNQTIYVRANQDTVFDASGSTGNNLKYLWVFGDDATSTEKKVSHKYDDSYYILFPMVRVTDENGLFSDTYALIDFTAPKNQNIFTRFFTWLKNLFQ